MRRLLSIVAILFPAFCFGQLSGEYNYLFTNNLPLWDFSGTYALTNGELKFENILVLSARGIVTGMGSAHVDDGQNSLNATNTALGKVSASARHGTRMSVAGAGQFTGTALGYPISGPFKGSLRLTLDPTNRTVRGPVSGTACVPTRGCRTFSTNATFELPANVDGSWSLTLNIETSNSVVRGTAAARLSNDRALSFNVTSLHSPSQNVSRLKLKGTGSAARTSLAVTVDSAGQLLAIKGKLFGQPLVSP